MYSAEERRVVPIQLRGKTLYYDPFEVGQRIDEATKWDLGGLLKTIRDSLPQVGPDAEGKESVIQPSDPPPPEAVAEAKRSLLAAVRSAFDMPEINRDTGEGFNRDECWQAWSQYCEWTRQKKASTAEQPT